MVESLLHTVVLYGVLIAVVRLMGKRQIGQMAASEFVVTMLVANLATIPLEDPDLPLHKGIIPIVTVLGLEIILSWLAMRSIPFRKLLCGKPVILMENGNVLQENLRKNRVNLDELTELLREKDVLDLKTVQYAILETNGNLSVFLYPKDKPASAKDAGVQAGKQALPLTIVSDGALLEDNLRIAKKDKAWVDKVLFQHNAGIKDTLLLTVDGNDKILFYRKEK